MRRWSGEAFVRVTAVRTRYEHIAAGWRRATGERRAGLLGELELLALQLPAVVQPQGLGPRRDRRLVGGHQPVDHRDHDRVGRSTPELRGLTVRRDQRPRRGAG